MSDRAIDLGAEGKKKNLHVLNYYHCHTALFLGNVQGKPLDLLATLSYPRGLFPEKEMPIVISIKRSDKW